MKTNDPVIDEIRRVRHVISAEVGPDLAGLVDRYAKLEAQFTSPPITKVTRQPSACAGALEAGERASNHVLSPSDDW